MSDTGALVLITGGIGSGKSHVCDLFMKYCNVPVFNTDEYVKEYTVKKPNIKFEILHTFGDDSYLENGSLNKEKFRRLLFQNPSELTTMNKIVTADLALDIKRWHRENDDVYSIVECAVVFEDGVDYSLRELFDITVSVISPMNVRLDMLTNNRGLDIRTSKDIIKIQKSDDERISLTDYVIQNDNDTLLFQMKMLDKMFKQYSRAKHQAHKMFN